MITPENRNWVCPERYHDVDDDETGQCYPNDEEPKHSEYNDYLEEHQHESRTN